MRVKFLLQNGGNVVTLNFSGAKKQFLCGKEYDITIDEYNLFPQYFKPVSEKKKVEVNPRIDQPVIKLCDSCNKEICECVEEIEEKELLVEPAPIDDKEILVERDNSLDLYELSYHELKSMCTEKGIDNKGKKSALIERLLK